MQPALATDALLGNARGPPRERAARMIAEAFAGLTPSRSSSGSTARRSPTRSVNTCTTSGPTRSWQARNRWTEVGSPAGPVPALLPPGAPEAFDAAHGSRARAGRALRADPRELGFGNDDGASNDCTQDEHEELHERPRQKTDDPGRELAAFAATLSFEDIPAPVLRRAEDLFLDWFASALAGKGARPVESIAAFFEPHGPVGRPERDPDPPHASSPLVAAWSTPPPRTSPSRTTCTTARCSIRPRW
jgi:hypothetical protein